MSYGWIYDHLRPGWLRAAYLIALLVISWRYGFVAVLLALTCGFAMVAYVIWNVEESDVEDHGGRRPWADDDFVS